MDYTRYTAQAAKHRQTLHTKRLAGTCVMQMLLTSHPHAEQHSLTHHNTPVLHTDSKLAVQQPRRRPHAQAVTRFKLTCSLCREESAVSRRRTDHPQVHQHVDGRELQQWRIRGPGKPEHLRALHEQAGQVVHFLSVSARVRVVATKRTSFHCFCLCAGGAVV